MKKDSHELKKSRRRLFDSKALIKISLIVSIYCLNAVQMVFTRMLLL